MSENRKKVTSKEAVLKAIAECDQIGTENFREKYGFRESRKYPLEHNGTFYDSKAILAVAHSYQYPDIGPLTPQTPGFSGGEKHAVRELEDLGFNFEKSNIRNISYWLLMVTENPAMPLKRPYKDEVFSSYEWDTTVNNASKLKVGDVGVFWDKDQLLGISVIQEIFEEEGVKDRLRCPKCSKAQGKPRKNLTPRYKCQSCGEEFEEPEIETIPITRFRSDHAAGWQDLFGLASGSELRSICVHQRSQNSIREINLSKFEELMSSKSLSMKIDSVRHLQEEINGGHKWRRVRTRIGQNRFRAKLLDKYGGPICAIVGVSPPETIQACHLYSFSEKGVHDKEGGLLMRSDLHSLFDSGLLRINPDSLKVVLSEELANFPDYWQFNNETLKVELSSGQKKWLEVHWEQHS